MGSGIERGRRQRNSASWRKSGAARCRQNQLLERVLAGVEIARRYFSFDEDGELATLTPPPEGELREIREAFDFAHERITRMIGEFKELGFFKHVWHLQRQMLCDNRRSDGASIEDNFSNELTLPE